MAFAHQIIPIRIGRGINTDIAAKVAPIGDLLLMNNLTFDKQGSLTTRNGHIQLDGGGATLGVKSLATLNNELLETTSTQLLSLIGENSTWQSKGTFVPAQVTSRVLSTSFAPDGSPDGAAATVGASSSLMEVYAWEQPGPITGNTNIMASVTDTTTGNIVVPSVTLQHTAAGGALGIYTPRVVAFAGTIYVFWAANATLWYSIFTAPNVFSAPAKLINGTGYAGTNVLLYDLIPWTVSGVQYLAVAYQAAGGVVTLATYSTGLGLVQSVVFPGGAANPTVISVQNLASSLNLGVGVYYTGSTTVQFAAYASAITLASISSCNQVLANVVNLTMEDVSGSVWRGWIERTQTGGLQNFVQGTPLDFISTAPSFGTYQKLNCGLAARAVHGMVTLVYASPAQSTLFFCETLTGSLYTIGKALYGSAAGYTTRPWLPSINGVNSFPTIWQGIIRAASGAPGGIASTTGINVVTVNTSPTAVPMNLELAGSVFLNGGQLWDYDGETVAEHDLNLGPDNLGVNSPGFQDIISGTNHAITCPPGAQIGAVQFLEFAFVLTSGMFAVKFTGGGAGGNGVYLDSTPAYTTVVTCPVTPTMSASEVATSLGIALAGFFGVSAVTVSGAVVSVAAGATVISQFTNGAAFSLTLSQTGTVGNPQIVSFWFPDAVHISPGQYFTIQATDNNAGASALYNGQVYFTVDGVGTAPGLPPGTGGFNIPVPILSTDNSTAVATKVLAAMKPMSFFPPGWVGALHPFDVAGTVRVANSVTVWNAYSVIALDANPTNVGHVGGGLGVGSSTGGPWNYQIACTYRWFDANSGQVHESLPTPPSASPSGPPGYTLQIGADGGGDIIVTVPTLQFTNKKNVTIELWCTTLNGSTFFRVTTPGQVLNDTSVATVQIRASLTDAVLQANDQLYTTGGVLENIAPPACSAICVHHGRLFLAGIEGDPSAVWYSTVIAPGQPPRFNDIFVIRYPAPIYALGTMDNTLVAWGANSIYAVGGDGPDATGNNGGFSTPAQIPGAIGCTAPDTVQQVPRGLLFSTSPGQSIRTAAQSLIFLLDRTFQLEYAGSPVEGILAALGGQPVAAVTVPGTNAARFVLPANPNVLPTPTLPASTFSTVINATIAASVAAEAPDGSQPGAAVLTDTITGVTTHTATRTLSVGATTYTMSLYAKAGTQGFIGLSPNNSDIAIFVLSGAGSVGFTTGGILSPSIVYVGGGWYRCAATVVTATGSNAAAIYMCNGSGAGGFSYAGTGTNTVYIWGPQFEQGAASSTYFPQIPYAMVYDFGSRIGESDEDTSQWGTFSYPFAPVDCVIWKGKFVWASGSNGVFQESAGATTDAGVAFTGSLTTSWLPFAQIGGMQRVRSLYAMATVQPGAALTFAFGYDEDPNYTDIKAWTAGTGAAYPSGQIGSLPNFVRVDPPRQKCKSMQITVAGIPPGASIERFTMDVRVDPDRPWKMATGSGNSV